MPAFFCWGRLCRLRSIRRPGRAISRALDTLSCLRRLFAGALYAAAASRFRAYGGQRPSIDRKKAPYPGRRPQIGAAGRRMPAGHRRQKIYNNYILYIDNHFLIAISFYEAQCLVSTPFHGAVIMWVW